MRLSWGMRNSDLRGQLEDFALYPTQEIRPELVVQVLDQFFTEHFILLLQRFQIVPRIGVKKVHEVEQLPYVIVQGCLTKSSATTESPKVETYTGHDNTMHAVQFIEFPK